MAWVRIPPLPVIYFCAFTFAHNTHSDCLHQTYVPHVIILVLSIVNFIPAQAVDILIGAQHTQYISYDVIVKMLQVALERIDRAGNFGYMHVYKISLKSHKTV